MHKNLIKPLLIMIFLIVSGCVAQIPIPESHFDNASAAAIKVGIDATAGWNVGEMIKIEKVLFIKLENANSSLKAEKLYESNYYTEPFITGFQFGSLDNFLMDIEPGIYAAVGAIGIGGNSDVKFYIYFPEEMVRQTITEIKKDSMAYMGEFKLKKVSWAKQMEAPDELQSYYFSNILFPYHAIYHDRANFTISRSTGWLKNPQFHSPILIKKIYSRDDELTFLKSHLNTFKTTVWKAKINNRIAELQQQGI